MENHHWSKKKKKYKEDVDQTNLDKGTQPILVSSKGVEDHISVLGLGIYVLMRMTVRGGESSRRKFFFEKTWTLTTYRMAFQSSA